MKTTLFTCFVVCRGLSNDDVGGARSTIFQEIRPAAGLKKPAISSKKCWGGYRSKTCMHFTRGQLQLYTSNHGPQN